MTLALADVLSLIGVAAVGITIMLVTRQLLDRADTLGPKGRRISVGWVRKHWSDAQFVWLFRVNVRFWWVVGLLSVLGAAAVLVSSAFGVEWSRPSR